MSSFWSIWISAIILGTIAGTFWLLWATRKSQKTDSETENTTGHVYDGIEEYDNPLPRWWFYLFVATIVFSLGYLVLYPGLGNFKGVLGWSSTGQYESEVVAAEEQYGPIYAQYASVSVEELSQNDEAMRMGQRLFATNCSVCHGSAARGGIGFPNLTDDAWLYGGAPDDIVHTLTEGRNGNMPAGGFMPNMSGAQVGDLVNYVLSFSGRAEDQASAERGEALFAQACAGCHGADATGNQQMGAPNLTDDAWLYGSHAAAIRETIAYGRRNEMPAQKDRLSEDQIHVLAAYVYGLSRD